MEQMSMSTEDHGGDIIPNVTYFLPVLSSRDESSSCHDDRKHIVKLESKSSDMITKLTSTCRHDSLMSRNSIPDLFPEVVEVKVELFYCQHCQHSDVSVDKLKAHMSKQHPTKAAVILNSIVEKSQDNVSDVTFFCVRESCTHFTSICYVYEDHLMSCCSSQRSISEAERKRLEASIKFLLVFHRNHGFKTPSGFLEFVSTNSNSSVFVPSIVKHELAGEKLFNGINDKGESLVHDTIPQQTYDRDSSTQTTGTSQSSDPNILIEQNKSLSDQLPATLSSQSSVVYKSEDLSFYITDNKDISKLTTSNVFSYEVTSSSRKNVLEAHQEETTDTGNGNNSIFPSEIVPQKASDLPALHGREISRVFRGNQPTPQFLHGDRDSHQGRCFRKSEDLVNEQIQNLDERECTSENSKMCPRPDIKDGKLHTLTSRPDPACEPSQFDVFNDCDNLDNHITTDEESKKHRCKECGKSFDHGRYLRTHMETHTGGKPYKYKCDECGKGFSRSHAFCIHVRSHTGEKPYKCIECDKSFSNTTHLQRHIRTHTGEKPYKCNECGKSFVRNGYLLVHMRTHTEEKPYKCYECGKSFSQNGHLYTHMRTHTGEKPYKCNECGKSFGQNGHLYTHMRTHTGEKPCKCNECGRCFSFNTSLHRHMRTHRKKRPKRIYQTLIA